MEREARSTMIETRRYLKKPKSTTAKASGKWAMSLRESGGGAGSRKKSTRKNGRDPLFGPAGKKRRNYGGKILGSKRIKKRERERDKTKELRRRVGREKTLPLKSNINRIKRES